MTTAVIAYIEVGEHAMKLHRAITRFCDERAFEIQILASTPEAAAQAVAAGMALIVVAGIDPRNGLRHLVTVAGGRTVFVRESSQLPTLREFLSRALRRGKTPRDIAAAVGSETTDISELITRLNLDQPKRPMA